MKIVNWIKREFFHILPVFLFFFVTFLLIDMTETLMTKREGIVPFSFGQVLLAALVISKVFLVLDHLSFMNAFSKKPLIYSIAWKTMIYFLVSLIIRLLDRLIPYLWTTESPNFPEFATKFNWPRFWAIEIWFLVLFLHFVTSREFKKSLGSAKIRKIFLGY